MNRPLAKALYFLSAAPQVIRAARKVERLSQGLAFDELLRRLREGAPRLPAHLSRHPLWLAGTVELLLPVLPPRTWGPCLRRSLVLLELWSRCGLAPRLHLGVRPDELDRAAHAWLSAELANGGRIESSEAFGHVEAFEL